MRTHNLFWKLKISNKPLTVAVLLVIGGIFSAFWVFGKSEFIKEQAAPRADSAFVQTAQGANLDPSLVVEVNNAAFSSSNSATDLTGTDSPSTVYPTGAVTDPGVLPAQK